MFAIRLCTFFCLLLLGSLVCAWPSAWAAQGSGSRGFSHFAAQPKKDPVVERKHTITESNPRYTVHVEYPSIGAVLVDADLAYWAGQQTDIFISGVSDIPSSDPGHFTLKITYERSQPSLRCASFIFTIETAMGTSAPETGIMTFTYHIQEGTRLGVLDIFQNTQGLLEFFSTYSRRHLGFKEWRQPDATFIAQGTTPHEMNFMFFAITAKGLTLYFPPKQVASTEEGCIALPIPLHDLMPFSPNLTLWGLPIPPNTASSVKP